MLALIREPRSERPDLLPDQPPPKRPGAVLPRALRPVHPAGVAQDREALVGDVELLIRVQPGVDQVPTRRPAVCVRYKLNTHHAGVHPVRVLRGLGWLDAERRAFRHGSGLAGLRAEVQHEVARSLCRGIAIQEPDDLPARSGPRVRIELARHLPQRCPILVNLDQSGRHLALSQRRRLDLSHQPVEVEPHLHRPARGQLNLRCNRDGDSERQVRYVPLLSRRAGSDTQDNQRAADRPTHSRHRSPLPLLRRVRGLTRPRDVVSWPDYSESNNLNAIASMNIV